MTGASRRLGVVAEVGTWGTCAAILGGELVRCVGDPSRSQRASEDAGRGGRLLGRSRGRRFAVTTTHRHFDRPYLQSDNTTLDFFFWPFIWATFSSFFPSKAPVYQEGSVAATEEREEKGATREKRVTYDARHAVRTMREEASRRGKKAMISLPKFMTKVYVHRYLVERVASDRSDLRDIALGCGNLLV